MSFGLSRGRTLEYDGYGLDAADLPAWDVGDDAARLVDPRDWFADPARPFEIEIGSGKGTFLAQQAPLQSEVNFLGIEQAGEFFRYAADRVRRHALANVRMLRADAVEFLRYRCPDAIARVIHVYFSDPWPKKRHHKRRVVQDASLAVFHRVLVPEGRLHLVTDHDDLWAWYEEHAERARATFERVEFAPPSSAGEGEVVGSNYERKFRVEGRTFRGMTLIRR